MPKYSEISPQGDSPPDHKTIDKSDVPTWCAHPLKTPSSQPNMLLFPGEMTHHAGMLAACQQLPLVQEMMELATEAFDFDVQRVFEECAPEDFANRTDRSQMLAYVADCAAYELFRQQQPEAAGNPRAVAGFSVGEIAALVAAGIISYDQGLTIVKARAEAMQRWVDEEEMAALAVFGMEEDQLNHLCARVDPEGKPAQKVFISHCWGRKGFVCSGASAALELLEVLVENEAQQEVVYKQRLEFRLDAGHTPLATAVAAEVEEVIKSIQMNPPQCEVYFNCGFRVAAGEDPSVFAPYLIQQLLMPLRWDVTIRNSLQRGIRRFFECGPGQSLKDLMIFNSFTASPSQTIRPAELTTLVQC
ncbi:Probable malonyl-CoA-acyl carrier protein transacylase [Durusdinium trenchii]|uniref:Mitochondrial (MCT) (Bad egg) ([Acyl-carrier-protein] malonyltransferase) n=1 Tax=Durusdinium trenchii TaxID=1381693 RepID=A0ABP0QHC4_9DINO